ncbi:MAG: hypothetical protein RLZZ336_2061 [Cyanobacteriota bacterium]
MGSFMRHVFTAMALISGLALATACGKPDTRALQILACQQVATSIDVQSVSQLDLLRKALGVAPGVDPIGTCRALGVAMDGQAPREQQQQQEQQEEQ